MTGLGSSCGACKFLRRRCTSECVFAPYFCYEEAATHFGAVHKVFGASNVSKLLSYLPVHNRSEAAISISYEALARMHDPVHGCVAHILLLQHQVVTLQEEIETLENQMADLGVDVSSFGSSEAITGSFSDDQSQVASQDYQMNLQVCQNQESTPSLSHELNTCADGQMNNMQLPSIFGLEDQNYIQTYSNSSPPLDRLFEGTDQGIFASHPWITNGSSTC